LSTSVVTGVAHVLVAVAIVVNVVAAFVIAIVIVVTIPRQQRRRRRSCIIPCVPRRIAPPLATSFVSSASTSFSFLPSSHAAAR
jgi:hypothetical protein